MAGKAEHEELIEAFEMHRKETEGHIERLDRVIDMLDFDVEREDCEAMEGLVEEGKQLMENIAKGPVLDAAMITAAQKSEHYEIASYGSLCALAKGLGYDEAAQILHETLEEEKATDMKLTHLAEKNINADAMHRAA